jgi:hypothetical protein
MKRTLQAVFLGLLAAQVLVVGQGADAKKVLAEVRAALGGEQALAAVKTLALQGQVTKSRPDGNSMSSDFEMALEHPDKFMKKEVFANIGGTDLKRRSGFNGNDAIEEMDAPPSMGGGGMHVMRMSPTGPMNGAATPEQLAAQRQQLLASSRRDFARLALGLFASSTDAFPVEFVYAGQAESPDGKADVLDVKGPDGFAAKFFIDGRTRLPLMLTWTDREPLRVMMTSPDQSMEQLMKEAEAKRRTVEYRMFYGEYKTFDGVKVPTKIQRMVDGFATEEIAVEKVKVNSKIPASAFQVVK